MAQTAARRRLEAEKVRRTFMHHAGYPARLIVVGGEGELNQLRAGHQKHCRFVKVALIISFGA